MFTTRLAAHLLVLIGLLLAAPLARGQNCNLEGAWEVVSLTLTDSTGTATEVEIGDPPGLKVLSAEHWVFVEQTEDEASPTSGGGGRYTTSDTTYTEDVQYHAAVSFVGKTLTFDCQVEGDRWYQRGMLPGGTYLEEVYRRVE